MYEDLIYMTIIAQEEWRDQSYIAHRFLYTTEITLVLNQMRLF